MSTVELSESGTAGRWLLLIHQIPAKPAYVRVRIWRRLQALGAITVKNSVYALPANEQTQEDFEWLLKEITGDGGETLICEARLVGGLSDLEVRAMFNLARDAEYDAVAKEARELAGRLSGQPQLPPRGDALSRLAKLRAELTRIAAIDFFGANGRETVAGLLAGLSTRLVQNRPLPVVQEGMAATGPLKGRVWVTRAGVHVDRIASAWLIRRFVDPEARFKFVAVTGYVPEQGELRFDMSEAEFTHVGDQCTFEVLRMRAGLTDPALVAIAEIVHDIDLKDGKFGREEAAGIARLIEGIAAAHADDGCRIERGSAVFDDLHAYFDKAQTYTSGPLVRPRQARRQVEG